MLGGFRPGPRTRRLLHGGESGREAGCRLRPARRRPARRRPAVDDQVAHAHVARPDVDTIASLHVEPAERSPGASRIPNGASGRAASSTVHSSPSIEQIDGAIEDAVDDARSAASRRRPRGRATALAAASMLSVQPMAAMKLSAFDTQPKIAPCALIISRPTRWNSGK